MLLDRGFGTFGFMSFEQVVVLVLVLVGNSQISFGEKSLFDDLPLNGALPEDSSYKTLTSPSELKKAKAVRLDNDDQEAAQDRASVQLHVGDIVQPVDQSLFDDFPDHGALIPSSPSHKERPTRDSVDFEITRANPSDEFDVPYWDSKLLSPIVNSLAKSPPSRVPTISHSYGPPPPQRFQGQRYLPPPPPQNVRNSFGPLISKSFSFFQNKGYSHPQQRRPYPLRRDELQPSQNKSSHHHVSANSGGPTVIVYAHPNKGSYPSFVSDDQTVSSPAPSQPSKEQSKNEIHYHYHINKQEESENAPSNDKGSGYSYVPKRSRRPSTLFYRNPKVTQAHGPPPMRQSPDSTGRNYISQNTNFVLSGNTEHLNDDDDFSRRTFISSSKGKGNNDNGYRPADSVSLTRPSTSYEVPPAFNTPSSSYNAPSSEYGAPSNTPEHSYGPPTAPPPGPPAGPPGLPSSDQAFGNDQYETTITLQTIPITRQVTELVQVPNVVHKVSSNRPSSISQSDQAEFTQDEPVPPPSSAYGVPSHQPRRKNIPKSPPNNLNLKASERPFDSHLSQILGVGPPSNSKDTVLQELLLGQARNPGYDLTLGDLELFSLLQGSRGGSSYANGIQSSVLNPQRNIFGGGLGLSSGSGVSRFNGANLFNTGLLQQRDQGLGTDGLGTLREAFREQRLQLALADLRKQLREQNRDNVRERSGYRSLFSKGALLLSALTLLPSMVSPMVSAAGIGSASAASTIPNFMLPMTNIGRRRRRSISNLETNSLSSPYCNCLEIWALKEEKNSTLPFKNLAACSKGMNDMLLPFAYKPSSNRLSRMVKHFDGTPTEIENAVLLARLLKYREEGTNGQFPCITELWKDMQLKLCKIKKD